MQIKKQTRCAERLLTRRRPIHHIRDAHSSLQQETLQVCKYGRSALLEPCAAGTLQVRKRRPAPKCASAQEAHQPMPDGSLGKPHPLFDSALPSVDLLHDCCIRHPSHPALRSPPARGGGRQDRQLVPHGLHHVDCCPSILSSLPLPISESGLMHCTAAM